MRRTLRCTFLISRTYEFSGDPAEQVGENHPLLSAWALQSLETVAGAESQDYSKAKKTLLHDYESTQGSLGKQVLDPKKEPGQRAAHLAVQLQRQWAH